ncbi:inositol monophosphatase family protein [Halocatena halophila]|uniref:inositol monophosphatase family protein n=1 Tax=Halocatena halophila TaxID=2814576 RepID=UPI002ED6227E
MTPDDELEAIATAAATVGGTVLRHRYQTTDRELTYENTDVSARADVAAERRMLPVIRTAFPEHAVYSEEAGDHGGSEPYQWFVDPLDGTNNYAAGIPGVASAVAVEHDGTPVVAAIYQPISDVLLVARQNDAITRNGVAVAAPTVPSPEASAVATIIGRSVPQTPALKAAFDEMETAINARVKRVIHSWAPTVHTSAFATGTIQAIVAFHPNEEERAAIELFAAESTATVRSAGGLLVGAHDERLLELLWDVTDELTENT